jgi:hypothetical protein
MGLLNLLPLSPSPCKVFYNISAPTAFYTAECQRCRRIEKKRKY